MVKEYFIKDLIYIGRKLIEISFKSVKNIYLTMFANKNESSLFYSMI